MDLHPNNNKSDCKHIQAYSVVSLQCLLSQEVTMASLNILRITLVFFNLCAYGFTFAPSSIETFHNPCKNEGTSRLSPNKDIDFTRLSAQNNDSSNSILSMDENKRSITSIPYTLNSIETLCMKKMDNWYAQSMSLKCPFMRRRMADVLDALDMVMRFLIIRHKSLDLIGPPPGCRPARMSSTKVRNLEMQDLLDTIRKDWRQDTNKGYYINGKLNTTIYRDDCVFDGPDPDMPVRGLRKYLNAAANLFDHSSSTAKLLSLEIVDEQTIEARWELEGVLHLPWHPKLPVWTGKTTYHLDNEGLVQLHEESWDISVLQAFTETLLPKAANLIWKEFPRS